MRFRYLWCMFFALDLAFVLLTTPTESTHVSDSGVLFNYLLLPGTALAAGAIMLILQNVLPSKRNHRNTIISKDKDMLRKSFNPNLRTFEAILNYASASYFAAVAVRQIFFWHYKSGNIFSYLILWRAVVNQSSILGNHCLIVLSVVFAYFAYVYALRFTLGLLSLLKAAVAIFFMIGIHEALWYASYLASWVEGNQSSAGNLATILWLTARSTFFILIPLIMFVYQSLMGFSRRDGIFFGITALFFLTWVAIGFPVSSNLNSPTQYFYSIPVNLIELLSWLAAEAAFLLTRAY